jgi:hypothetical protein
MGSSSQQIPYWHVNVPEDEREDECPPFLVNLVEKDRIIIGTRDEDYQVDPWPVVRQRVADNKLHHFHRVPSQLRRYLSYNWQLKQNYGSIMNFVVSQRLHWNLPIEPRGKPFEFDDDIKILYNDWPYGIDPRIIHLVVWTKFRIVENSITGDLTDESRSQIQSYVDRVFGSRTPKHHVC